VTLHAKMAMLYIHNGNLKLLNLRQTDSKHLKSSELFTRQLCHRHPTNKVSKNVSWVPLKDLSDQV